MSLSNERLIKKLNKNFVCGWTNIKGKESYAGSSNTHLPEYSAICVDNSAGHGNIQMFFMTGDGKVIHCLPGFWSARHLVNELEFARKLARVYYKKSLSPAKRNAIFLSKHLEHALQHDPHTRSSSNLQYFDKKNIASRKKSDFKRDKGFIKGSLKTADQVIHERMAQYPFISFDKFEVAKFVDMGRKRYSYKHGLPGKEHCEEECESSKNKKKGGYAKKKKKGKRRKDID